MAGQAREHILQIGVGLNTVQIRRLSELECHGSGPVRQVVAPPGRQLVTPRDRHRAHRPLGGFVVRAEETAAGRFGERCPVRQRIGNCAS